MKNKFLLILTFIGLFLNAKEIKREDIKSTTALKSIFIESTTSLYDPMDVFGILTFLMQTDPDEKYNYEKIGLTWEDMASAISGNPDQTIDKINDRIKWINGVNGKKVITELDLNGYWIEGEMYGTFDGKYFSNLKELNIDFNKLTHVDISKNINLTYLDCCHNQLKSLDVTKNVNLKQLWCNDNKLTYLNISKNILLTNLGNSENQLTSLDVTNNLNLNWLVCSKNQLTSLNLSKNINLGFLSCRNNQIKNLDISNNINLTEILCENNLLTQLNLPDNSLLTRLQCENNQLVSLDLTKQIKLVNLYFDNNQLTSIDLSNNSLLAYFTCNQNQLNNLDISKNNLLVSFSCYYNQLKFSTLIYNYSTPINNFHTNYQAKLQGGVKGYFEIIDLSSEYNINNTLTTYKWYDTANSKEISMFSSNGTFYASPTNAGKTLLCKMENSLYPGMILEYKVTITNNMMESTSTRMVSTNNLLDGFKLVGPDINTQNLSISPNPVTDILKINSSSTVNSITVYNYSGREVKRISPITNNQINVQDLPSGNYILNILTDHETITKKIIKK